MLYNDSAAAIRKAQAQGSDVQAAGERLEGTPVRFIFKQDEKALELRGKIDAALQKNSGGKFYFVYSTGKDFYYGLRFTTQL